HGHAGGRPRARLSVAGPRSRRRARARPRAPSAGDRLGDSGADPSRSPAAPTRLPRRAATRGRAQSRWPASAGLSFQARYAGTAPKATATAHENTNARNAARTDTRIGRLGRKARAIAGMPSPIATPASDPITPRASASTRN